VQVGGPAGGGPSTATDGAASPMDLDLEGPSAGRPAASASVAGGAAPKQRKFRKAGWVELEGEGGAGGSGAGGEQVSLWVRCSFLNFSEANGVTVLMTCLTTHMHSYVSQFIP
jgi:hypothetical protein